MHQYPNLNDPGDTLLVLAFAVAILLLLILLAQHWWDEYKVRRLCRNLDEHAQVEQAQPVHCDFH